MNEIDPKPEPSRAQPPGQPSDFNAIVIGAGFIIAVWFIPYSFLLCCVPQILGALLTLHLFTWTYKLTLSVGDGMKLGIITAVFGGLVCYLIYLAVWMLFNHQLGMKEFGDAMLKFADLGGPDTVQQVKDAIQEQTKQVLDLETVVIQLCWKVVTSTTSGMIGGAIGASLFKRNPLSRQ